MARICPYCGSDLPEAAAGAVSPRHVVVPLRRVLRGAEIIAAKVTE